MLAETVVRELEDLRQHAERVAEFLARPDQAALLAEQLHNPDELPRKDLWQTCASVVDSLDRVQLIISPSVSLLADCFFGYLPTKALWTAVDARVPDLLAAHGPQTVEQLAQRAGLQPQRLQQLLDTLAPLGIFAHTTDATITNSRASALLTRDHWAQWHRWADLYGTDFFDASRCMPLAVRAGERRSAAQLSFDTELSLFDYMAQTGLASKFHATLGAGQVAMAKGFTVDYPWAEIESSTSEQQPFIDLGGGSGALLASVLRAHPRLRGALMDLGHVVDMVEPDFRSSDGKFADVADRVVALHRGNFLESVPPAAVYTMKWCLHDWSDDDVVKVFRVVRRCIDVESAVSRLVVFEAVKTPKRSGRISRYGDLVMMVTANGQERAEEDWRRLAGAAGWRLANVYPLRDAWAAGIELRPI
ncbi:O-methyltransferase [Lasiodiplodia theobromae]|uniref:O-methyltransferase n=1 Tax=Lasiodiplodia theobromae TaxID=45133 RepID=UPI0015C39881|nr:O-methyltransferase [Lasiodiplodia theobromae]KAF4541998.1 O-methyltransferase [Lasiodiplodia theobromae]